MLHRGYRIRSLRTFSVRSISSQKARPDVLVCDGCDLYKFGDPTSEPSRALFRNLRWRIRDGAASTSSEAQPSKPEAWALVGPRAGLLADAALLGRSRADPPSSRSWPFVSIETSIEDVVKKVAFNTRLESSSYLATAGEFTDFTARYYSIRPDEEEAVTLRQHLSKYVHDGPSSEANTNSRVNGDFLLDTARALKLDHLLHIPLIALSNGQTRRARIARALLSRPKLLILEEPFTGLDVASRKLIADLLGSMHASRSPRILLILRPQDKIPDWVDCIAELSSQDPQTPAYLGERGSWQPSLLAADTQPSPGAVARKRARSDAPCVIRLDHANVGYGDRQVLKGITWHIKQGDRVALSGANGSGKSTLLSLILGDHPASYSQSLSIFGLPRDKHSVFSLSAQTGQFSPELFASFPRRYGDAGLSIFETIGTGFENVFSYRKLSGEQKNRIDELVKGFDPQGGILTSELLHKTLFVEAPPPMQALALILRALVKKPALVVLDEPFAGMDEHLIRRCKKFLDTQLDDTQTLVFISHYTEEWPATLGKCLHLDDGKATETVLE